MIRLGHVVLEVADYQATCAWYTQHFGFIPSDVQVLPDGSPAVAFMRLDLGDTPADHHTLALAQGFMPPYSHSAYELVDADAVGMGQRVLREKGWTHAWGIGRHILGSQIFDYWQDPWGDKHEHYCDGDLFTADQPMGVHAGEPRGDVRSGAEPMPRSLHEAAASRRRRCWRPCATCAAAPISRWRRCSRSPASSADSRHALRKISACPSRRPLPASRAHPVGRPARAAHHADSRRASPRPAI